jgi:hypothetical protein
MNFFVGVTDNEWFRFLTGLDAPEEVNFSQPRGPRRFRAPVVLRKTPRSRLAGRKSGGSCSLISGVCSISGWNITTG